MFMTDFFVTFPQHWKNKQLQKTFYYSGKCNWLLFLSRSYWSFEFATWQMLLRVWNRTVSVFIQMRVNSVHFLTAFIQPYPCSQVTSCIQRRICNYWMKTVFLLRNVKTDTSSDWQCFVITLNFSTVEWWVSADQFYLWNTSLCHKEL